MNRSGCQRTVVAGGVDHPARSPPPPNGKAELAELRALASQRGATDIARIRWWNTGGPAYRWNELAIEAMMDDFVTLPLAARHLALLHAAIDDAVAAAWANKGTHGRRRPSGSIPSWQRSCPFQKARPTRRTTRRPRPRPRRSAPMPARAAAFNAAAEEAMRSRLLAGLEFPSDAAAGRVHRKEDRRPRDRARQGRWKRCKVDGKRAAGLRQVAGHKPDRGDGGTVTFWGSMRRDELNLQLRRSTLKRPRPTWPS